jgi:hypothetical protein
MIAEINEFLHATLPKRWCAAEWQKMELKRTADVHPLIKNAFLADQQIQHFIRTKSGGITPEIFELAELASKANALARARVRGIERKIKRLISDDFDSYGSAKYEIQVAGVLLLSGHEVEFIAESNEKTADILVCRRGDPSDRCEFECKYKSPGADQTDYLKSLYENAKKARHQFSGAYPGLICIEVDKNKFVEFQAVIQDLHRYIDKALRNSSRISAILLTSKIIVDEGQWVNYRHCSRTFLKSNAVRPVPQWIKESFTFVEDPQMLFQPGQEPDAL